MSEDALFPTAPSAPLQRGDKVLIRTMWGDEHCDVVDVIHDSDGWPMATLRTSSGDKVTINIARVERVED